jgi:hypothetical protein
MSDTKTRAFIVFKCNDLAQCICNFTDYDTQRSIKIINKKVKVTLEYFKIKFFTNKNYKDYLYDKVIVNCFEELHFYKSIKVKYLEFGNNFNQSLDNIQLPELLQSLKFGWDFNQSLDNVQLPNSLKSLTTIVGSKLYKSLDKVKLPCSINLELH